MKNEYTISDKIKYIKWKAKEVNTSNTERFDIINFLINDAGLFGKELKPKKFIKELNRLTADISHKQNKR
ncbi:MAG: hypothetical protein HOC41_07040 [Candidatus Marinimicrobia bacterium]|jgi:hypothetical protein|nr:hypothetical protein [Candidatus Neomarinimicrobiota bacterium]MBT6471825.1 hypothetical protein [Candidatus Neomarinimicrobiota bacterium]MBT6937541.1 hypothetical protein [Candidatus Neomarinimicrobiota bacterium]MBT7900770.1 hypothetical protein [Candidatus Neomarinimicrobiota bacterium]